MKTVREVSSLSEIEHWLRSELAPFGVAVPAGSLTCERLSFDGRVGWDTHQIALPGYGVVGQSNGPLT